ncbi:uncharacterized protein LOC102036169 [Geospiza fortis]|uniref:Vacuolar fusion protein MON1 homolog n=1 Tax=Geospiza fortis TaxID=48883 RepID=A0A8N5I592_GEOFO|nr:uncharacterized protein LOC102036169 [Geospiza fortis]
MTSQGGPFGRDEDVVAAVTAEAATASQGCHPGEEEEVTTAGTAAVTSPGIQPSEEEMTMAATSSAHPPLGDEEEVTAAVTSPGCHHEEEEEEVTAAVTSPVCHPGEEEEELRHFLYKPLEGPEEMQQLPQFTSPELEEPYTSEEEQHRLFDLYHYLHSRVHSPHRPLRLLYHVAEKETLLAWVTSKFELYSCFSPLVTKAGAIAVLTKLLRWLKKEEDWLFIRYPAPFCAADKAVSGVPKRGSGPVSCPVPPSGPPGGTPQLEVLLRQVHSLKKVCETTTEELVRAQDRREELRQELEQLEQQKEALERSWKQVQGEPGGSWGHWGPPKTSPDAP